MVAEPPIADTTTRTLPSKRVRIVSGNLWWKQSCWPWDAGDSPVPRVCHPCLCEPVRQKFDDGRSNSRSGAAQRTDGTACEDPAGQAIRDATERATAVENRARAAETAAAGAAGAAKNCRSSSKHCANENFERSVDHLLIGRHGGSHSLLTQEPQAQS